MLQAQGRQDGTGLSGGNHRRPVTQGKGETGGVLGCKGSKTEREGPGSRHCHRVQHSDVPYFPRVTLKPLKNSHATCSSNFRWRHKTSGQTLCREPGHLEPQDRTWDLVPDHTLAEDSLAGERCRREPQLGHLTWSKRGALGWGRATSLQVRPRGCGG